MLDSKLLFTRHLPTVSNTATGLFCNIFPLLARYSAPTHSNKLTLYKLLIRSILTYAAPLWSSTCSSNYLRLQVIQSKRHRVIGKHLRRTPTSHRHNSLNILPFPVFIQGLSDKFCSLVPNPLVQQIGTYILIGLTDLYQKYKRKRTTLISLPEVAIFLFIIFHCR